MGNKVRTKNVRIYGEHGECNTLCLFMDHGWGRSYSLWSVQFKIKQKTVEGTDTPYEKGKENHQQTSRERSEHLIKGGFYKKKKIQRCVNQ